MSSSKPTDAIQQIETLAHSYLANGEIAHDFKHVDRVRRSALTIAQEEGYPHLDRVEAAALLHDIGLVHGRKHHGETGAKMASDFLHENNLFPREIIAEITDAIRAHNSLEDQGTLADILRDADILDMLGPVGLMRAFTSKANKPEYLPGDVKGETWGINADQVTERFASGMGIGDTIVDQINFQISCFENLHTPTAREIARPLVTFMETFMRALEAQINQDKIP